VANGGISEADIRAVKDFVSRIGAGPLKELANVLSD
jgi:hypothetical protein